MSTILVVDDESTIRDLAQMILEDAGYRVVLAQNGKEALQKIQAEAPDLVLLDMVMPEMSGLEVCKRLKSDPKTKLIPVVMFTVLGRDTDVEKAKQGGCDSYFVKPFTPSYLVAEVKRHL